MGVKNRLMTSPVFASATFQNTHTHTDKKISILNHFRIQYSALLCLRKYVKLIKLAFVAFQTPLAQRYESVPDQIWFTAVGKGPRSRRATSPANRMMTFIKTHYVGHRWVSCRANAFAQGHSRDCHSNMRSPRWICCPVRHACDAWRPTPQAPFGCMERAPCGLLVHGACHSVYIVEHRTRQAT